MARASSKDIAREGGGVMDEGNGWERVEEGGKTFYRDIGTGDKLSERLYSMRVTSGKIPKPHGYSNPDREPHRDEAEYQSNEPASMPSFPEPKSRATRASAGKATSKELALAFETNLLILTSIVSLFTGLPDVAMSEQESKSIAIPAANIFESSDLNKQIGKTIANSGDYSLLGYAIYLYLFRVVTANRARNGQNVRSQPTNSPAPEQGSTGGAGAALPFKPAGLRNYTA
jgi:hypothetical protein